MHKDRLKVYGSGRWVKCSDFCDDMTKIQQNNNQLNLTSIIDTVKVRNGKYILIGVIIGNV